MNNVFQIGEIAILQNIPSPFDFLNGQECEVLGPMEPRYVIDAVGSKGVVMAYLISTYNKVGAAPPSSLRKKIPPSKQTDTDFGKTVSWNDCAWHPELEPVMP